MKTAMTELIDWVENGTETNVYVIRDKAKELLEKEKEQIMKAYCDGFDELLPFHENDYYNQTYNQMPELRNADGTYGSWGTSGNDNQNK